MGNKIKFGLKNVHYARQIPNPSGGIPTYETPKRIRGGVSLSLEPRGDMVEFYADDMLYYSASNNQGYDGTLGLALVPDEFRTEILGEVVHSNDLQIESSTDRGSKFALMFEFDGDISGTRHLLYNCTASRPTIESETKNDSPEPQIDELTFVASPRDGDYKVKAKAKTTSVEYDTFFDAVVEGDTQPTGLSLSPTSVSSLSVGMKQTLTASFTPLGSNATVTYVSADPTIATVVASVNGASAEVTGVKIGTTTITATTSNGKSVTINCTVVA